MDGIDDQYDPHTIEETVGRHWAETDAYAVARAAHADDPPWVFVDGPPYTSGQMHLGTAWNKTLKDAVLRYKRMSGYDVRDRPGYDMHGLPIEVKVEAALGFDSKRDIETFGIEAFIEECRRFAIENREAMDLDFQSIGVWMDWDDPYQTLTPEYMEAAWWVFKQVAERGLLDRGKRSVAYCPRCQTAIAANEVEYDEVTSPSIYVAFPLVDADASIVIWTTTPWTLPANTFVGVDPGLTYTQLRVDDGQTERSLIVAAACVDAFVEATGVTLLERERELAGTALVGMAYTHPMEDVLPKRPAGADVYTVQAAPYVEADRTGLVHSAPGHGQEDFARGTELDVEVVVPVDHRGVFTDAAGPYAGTFVRDANAQIITDLDATGTLVAADQHRHRYGHCWRCDTDIIYLATDQWFITITDIKQELLENIAETEWYPQWARDNRFTDFVADAPDWNISRQRYWGIPLPIWVAPDGAYIVIGTRAELAERVDQDVDPDEIDLHRPSVDPLTITEGGTTYHRVEDVFDVWIDSAVASWGSIGAPTEESRGERDWPADFITEAHDQTRGWFWSQLGMGTAAMGTVPYREVLMHGFVNDAEGRKMSKSRGNIVTPEEAIDRVGRDPLRAYLLSHDQHGVDLSFSWEAAEAIAAQLNIVWNVFRFPLTYMRLDGFDAREVDLDAAALTPIDRWVLSRLQATIAAAQAGWDSYATHEVVASVLEFLTEDVSRFYIQSIRDRMWEEEDSASKQAAYATMAHLLDVSIRLLAPIVPYLTERMYQELDGRVATVHALAYPEADPDRRDRTLEEHIAAVRAVEEAAATARQQGGRKRRWAVPRVIVETADQTVTAAVATLGDLLADRINAEQLEVTERFEETVEVAQPIMSEIGPAFGARAEAVMEALDGRPRAEVEDGLTVDGESVSIDAEMVRYETTPRGAVEAAPFDAGMVYVDVSVPEHIAAEGYARDVIRRVQQLRKELDLPVDAQIVTAIETGDAAVQGYIDEHQELIATETRTERFSADTDAMAAVVDEEVEGTPMRIGIAQS
jgi:Isoleucyl-tRNA synthetase (EC 6.1.1.5)